MSGRQLDGGNRGLDVSGRQLDRVQCPIPGDCPAILRVWSAIPDVLGPIALVQRVIPAVQPAIPKVWWARGAVWSGMADVQSAIPEGDGAV